MADAEEPKSLLFLSCDLVGSTAYKQTNSDWRRTFLSFYREFPEALDATQKRLKQYGGTFQLWKPVGDELIFVTGVRSETDIYFAVRTWLEAMKYYDEDTLKDEGLSTKGGAFIATFPGPDSEASIPRKLGVEDSAKDVADLNYEALDARDGEAYLYDYFGPSIDTGFRVLSQCSQRFFTMSVEVAWALSHFATNTDRSRLDEASRDVVFRGRVFLKGVWRGREYPIFAIDRERGDGVHDALRKLERQDISLDDIRAVCQECCGSEHWPSKLYLPESSNTVFSEIPANPLPRRSPATVEGIESEAQDGQGDNLDANPPVDLG